MVEERSSKGSIRAKLARRFTAIAIGAALAACLLGYAATWVWSDSVVRDLTREFSAGSGGENGSDGENPPMGVGAFLSQLLDAHLLERVADVRGWASAPSVLHAVQQANASREVSGLPNPAAEALESEVRGSLGRFPVADGYLHGEVADSKDFDWIRVTDRNGLDVVATGVRSEFVHSGEDWWQRAWSDGAAIEEVTYDEKADRWTIGVSMRIDDPATGRPVGVLQAALNLASIHDITDRFREHGHGERITVADHDGLLLAETASEHSNARLMNDKVNLRMNENDARRAAYEDDRWGQVIEDGWATEYSRSAGDEFYADATRGARYPGFDWVVIVQSRQFGAPSGIDAGQETVGAWRRTYAGILGAGFLVIALLAGGVTWWMADRVSRPIRHLHAAAVQMSQGRTTGTLRLDTNDELSEVADAFERIRRIIRQAVRVLHERQKGSTARDTEPSEPAAPMVAAR